MHPNGAGHSVRVVCVMWLLPVSLLLLPVATVRGHDYGTESGSKESIANGAKYDNHLNTSQAFQQADLAGGYDSAELTAGYGDGPDSLFNHHQLRCQACQYRNVYAMASLKSIKAHVLLKLGIEQVPNRTRYPEVPRRILDHFYNTQSYHHTPDPDYMGDEPSSLQADELDEPEEDYDYYQITNKIYILPNPNMNGLTNVFDTNTDNINLIYRCFLSRPHSAAVSALQQSSDPRRSRRIQVMPASSLDGSSPSRLIAINMDLPATDQWGRSMKNRKRSWNGPSLLAIQFRTLPGGRFPEGFINRPPQSNGHVLRPR